MKRAIAVSLTLGLLCVLALAGCGNRTGGGASTAGTTTPITFTFYNADAVEDMDFNDPVAKKITEATGVTLKIDHPVAGDTQTLALMIASGNYADLIYAKGDLAALIEADAVIPLDDLIEKRGTNIKKLYGDQLQRLRNTTEDPHIYNFGTYGVVSGMWATDGSMQLQHAVLKDQGYPRMQTLADYERAIKNYMAKYPTINGQKTIGLSLRIDTWQWIIDLGNTANYLIGYPDDGEWIVDQNTLEAYFKFLNPDMKLWYKWLNRMYAEGILDPESFTQKEDEWQAKIASGRVLGIAYPSWGYTNARTSLVADGMPERTYAYLPIVADERFSSGLLRSGGFSGGYGIAISKSCKDPERAFDFIDWMCSEEAQILLNWGIEGVNYNVVNGIRVVPPEEQHFKETDTDYGKKTGVGRWSYPFPQYGTGYIDSTGNWITTASPETIKQNYLPVEKETLAAYGAEMWTDLFPSPESLGVSKHGVAWLYTLTPELNAKVTEADDYTKLTLSSLVVGKPEDFEAGWDRYVQGLRDRGIEEANRALTALARDKVKLWGGN